MGFWSEYLQKKKKSRAYEGFQRDGVYVMNVSGSKNRVTSRRSGQHRDVPERFNFNVATFEPTL